MALTGRNNVVQDGSVGRICPQAVPGWVPVQDEFVADLIAGNASSFKLTQAEQQYQIGSQNAPPPTVDPRTTEDCLFLDVIVPKKVFDGANSRSKGRQASDGVPVVVWVSPASSSSSISWLRRTKISGGGSTTGWKGDSGDQAG